MMARRKTIAKPNRFMLDSVWRAMWRVWTTAKKRENVEKKLEGKAGDVEQARVVGMEQGQGGVATTG